MYDANIVTRANHAILMYRQFHFKKSQDRRSFLLFPYFSLPKKSSTIDLKYFIRSFLFPFFFFFFIANDCVQSEKNNVPARDYNYDQYSLSLIRLKRTPGTRRVSTTVPITIFAHAPRHRKYWTFRSSFQAGLSFFVIASYASHCPSNSFVLSSPLANLRTSHCPSCTSLRNCPANNRHRVMIKQVSERRNILKVPKITSYKNKSVIFLLYIFFHSSFLFYRLKVHVWT